MSTTIDTSILAELTQTAFGVQLSLDQAILSGQTATELTGVGGEKLYGYFPQEEEKDSASMALFYEVDKENITLDNNLLGSHPVIEPLISILRSSGAGKVWFCYGSKDTIEIPKEVLSQLNSHFPDQLKLDAGNSVIYEIDTDSFAKAFRLPEKIFPFPGTSLKLHFGEEAMNFSVSIRPDFHWLGESFSCDTLEVGLIVTYGGDDAQQYELYLSAEVTVFDFSASFFASIDIADGKPQGMSFEIHPSTELMIGNGVEKLGKLFPSNADWKLPVDISMPNVQINSIAGNISFTDGLISFSGNISTKFGNDGWSPIGKDLFTLEKVDLDFSWQEGLPLSWKIGGEVDLFDAYKLNLTYAHPNQIISAQLLPLDDGQQQLQELLNKHLGMGPAAEVVSDALTAFDLSIYADIPGDEVEFKIKNAKEWELIKGILTVSNLEIRANWYKKEFAEAELYLDLELPIGPKKSNVVVELEGAYDASDTPAVWHFEAEVNDPIAVGDLITGLAGKFGVSADAIPEQLKKLIIDDLYLSFDHQGESSEFKFSGNVIFPLSDDHEFNLHLEIDVKKTAGPDKDSKAAWEVKLGAALQLGGYEFAADFESNDSGKFLIASLSSDARINLADLLEEIAPDSLDHLIPEALEFGLQNAFVAFHFPKSPEAAATSKEKDVEKGKTTVVFGLGLALDATIDFGIVPGIGPLMSDVEISVENMRVVGSTVDISADTLAIIDAKLGEKSIPGLGDNGQKALPAGKGESSSTAFAKGITLSADLKLPGLEVKLAHSFGARTSTDKKGQDHEGEQDGEKEQDVEKGKTCDPEKKSNPVSHEVASSAPAVHTQKNRMLSPVGKKVGPFFVESVGLVMKDDKFGLKFTGGITVGPLVAELINFSFLSSFDRFDPSFDLDGLAIGYDKEPLTVSGMLMKVEEIIPEGASEDRITRSSFGFRGGISVGFKAVSLTALAAYSHVKLYEPPGKYDRSFHSFFLYGYLGAPLGGPPFLFVTGLALGVGFNRDLITPGPEKFDVFPLTAAALKPSGTALTVNDLKDMMLSLDEYIPIKENHFWFAAGIKFESFKFLSGFLMLTVEFGEELEVGVLGIIDAVMPMGIPDPLVRISIGFSVRVLPERGVVEVKGSFLPSTFILHKDVKLQGGMALLAIMKDQQDGQWAGAKAGEFVFTLGGYGPLYKPKPYYPVVPALQLSWQVDENLYVSASAYFALTPAAIMLGAALTGHYSYQGSHVSAIVEFKIAIDFILHWQPVQYLGKASATFDITGHIEEFFFEADISLNAAAELTIWGPEFSGSASLKLHFMISFEVEVEFGAASRTIAPISWNEFGASLLPPADKVINVNLANGLIQTTEQHEIPTVNPLGLKIVVDTQIPVTHEKDQALPDGPQLGIKAMGCTSEKFLSQVEIIITVENGIDVIEKFDLFPIYKNVPSALWQPAIQDGLISGGTPPSEMIENVLCGYEIKPKRVTIEEHDFVSIPESSVDDTLEGMVEGLIGGVYDSSAVNVTDLFSSAFLKKPFYQA